LEPAMSLQRTSAIAGKTWTELESSSDDELDNAEINARVQQRVKERLESQTTSVGNSPRRTQTEDRRRRNNRKDDFKGMSRNASWGEDSKGHRQEVTPAPEQALTTEIDGVTHFAEEFDIWFADGLRRAGTHANDYNDLLQKVGSFKTLDDLYEFHDQVDWSSLNDGCIIAYCRAGIKPQWEDPANSAGGRFTVKDFPRRSCETVFTALALHFLGQLFTDYPNYNLISLHVRPASRGTDVQLWRKLPAGRTQLTLQTVQQEILGLLHGAPGLVSPPTVTWVPNKESLARNDSRMGGKRGKPVMGTDSVGFVEAVFDSGPSKGEIDPDLKRRLMEAAELELMAATPAGAGIDVGKDAPALVGTVSQSRTAMSRTPSVSGLSTAESSPVVKSTGRPKFSFVGDLLSSEPAKMPIVQLPQSPTHLPAAPYPSYDLEVNAGIWAKVCAEHRQ